MSVSIIAYALVVLLVFFLLVGKFAKCCYNCSRGTTVIMTHPFYVDANQFMPIINTTSQRIPLRPTYDDVENATRISVGQTHVRNTTLQRISPCPSYNTAVTTTEIALGQIDFDFASPMGDLRYPIYPVPAPVPPPSSYYEDPPPSYDQVCGITNAINEHQSRQI